METFERFVQMLLDWNPPGPQLHVSIKYRSDDLTYRVWQPPLGCRLTGGGLPDPGFGSGPVLLEEIEFIVVHDKPALNREVPGYSENFAAFIEHTQSLGAIRFVEQGAKIENTD